MTYYYDARCGCNECTAFRATHRFYRPEYLANRRAVYRDEFDRNWFMPGSTLEETLAW